MYKQVKINITKKQLDNALSGKSIRVLPGQIGQGDIYLSMHPANVKTVEKAALKGKGCNIYLSPGELLSTAEDMDGNGLFGDIYKRLKSGYSWVKKNIIDSDLYQKGLKPVVRGAVDSAAMAASTAFPQFAIPISMAKEEIGKKTGAFGAKRLGYTKSARMDKLKAKGLYLS